MAVPSWRRQRKLNGRDRNTEERRDKSKSVREPPDLSYPLQRGFLKSFRRVWKHTMYDGRDATSRGWRRHLRSAGQAKMGALVAVAIVAVVVVQAHRVVPRVDDWHSRLLHHFVRHLRGPRTPPLSILHSATHCRVSLIVALNTTQNLQFLSLIHHNTTLCIVPARNEACAEGNGSGRLKAHASGGSAVLGETHFGGITGAPEPGVLCFCQQQQLAICRQRDTVGQETGILNLSVSHRMA